MITVLLVQGAGERAGAERMLVAMLRNIDRTRFRPVVAFLDRGPFVDEVRATENTEAIVLTPMGRLRDFLRIPGTVRELRDAINAVGADVIHCFGEKVAVPGGIAARLEGVPSVVRLHDAPATFRQPGTAAVQTAMALAPKHQVVACSHWLADAFNARYRLGARGIRNGVDAEALPAPGAGRGALLEVTGFAEEHVVFGHFGRLESWKGVHVFVRAAAAVVADDATDTARFVVVGGALYERDLGYAAMLPGLATASGIGHAVRFVGHRRDAIQIMSGCDVVVHAATRPEPLGNVVLEAMGTGRPVIASRSKGPEETVTEGVTGLLTDVGDHDQLAAAMRRLLRDPDERRRFADAGLADITERWSIRRMTDDFERLWAAAAAGRRADLTGGSGLR